MPKSGDVVITRVQFADSEGSKIRPALVLFEELGNIVIAGITTNLQMKGIRISTSEGAELNAIAKAASMGRKVYMLIVKIGISAPAAIGISIIL